MPVITMAEIALLYAVDLGLLFYLYPWATYSKFDFPRNETIAAYIIAAAMLVAVSLGPQLLLAIPRLKLSEKERLLQATVAAAILSAIVCIAFGPFGRNIASTRVSGIFFSERKFAVFFFHACLPSCCIAALLEQLRARHTARTSSAA